MAVFRPCYDCPSIIFIIDVLLFAFPGAYRPGLTVESITETYLQRLLYFFIMRLML
jgi:hypothetical protein